MPFKPTRLAAQSLRFSSRPERAAVSRVSEFLKLPNLHMLMSLLSGPNLSTAVSFFLQTFSSLSRQPKGPQEKNVLRRQVSKLLTNYSVFATSLKLKGRARVRKSSPQLSRRPVSYFVHPTLSSGRMWNLYATRFPLLGHYPLRGYRSRQNGWLVFPKSLKTSNRWKVNFKRYLLKLRAKQKVKSSRLRYSRSLRFFKWFSSQNRDSAPLRTQGVVSPKVRWVRKSRRLSYDQSFKHLYRFLGLKQGKSFSLQPLVIRFKALARTPLSPIPLHSLPTIGSKTKVRAAARRVLYNRKSKMSTLTSPILAEWSLSRKSGLFRKAFRVARKRKQRWTRGLRPRLRFRLKRSRRRNFRKIFQHRANLYRASRWAFLRFKSTWKPTSALYSSIRSGKFHAGSRFALPLNRPSFTPNIRTRLKRVRLHFRSTPVSFTSPGYSHRPSLRGLSALLANTNIATLSRRCRLSQHLRMKLVPVQTTPFFENNVFFKPLSQTFFNRSPMFGLLKCLNFSSRVRSRRALVSAQHGSPVHGVFPAAQALKVFVFRRLRRQKSFFRRLNLQGTFLTSPRKRLKASAAGAGRGVQGHWSPHSPALHTTTSRYSRVFQSRNTMFGHSYNLANMRVPRIRFKPGYGRIWREGRKSIRIILNLPIRYQYRLTPKLHTLYQSHRALPRLRPMTTLGHVLMSAKFFPDSWSVSEALGARWVHLNGVVCKNANLSLFTGDFIQLIVSLNFYLVFRWLHNSHLSRLSKVVRLFHKRMRTSRPQARRKKPLPLPDWFLEANYTFVRLPKRFEVDYFTLSVFVVYDTPSYSETKYLHKLGFNYGELNMYNWKYIT